MPDAPYKVNSAFMEGVSFRGKAGTGSFLTSSGQRSLRAALSQLKSDICSCYSISENRDKLVSQIFPDVKRISE